MGETIAEIRTLAKNYFRVEDEEVVWKYHFEVPTGENVPMEL